MITTEIELLGTEIEVVASQISKETHDRWEAKGFPSNEDCDTEEYEKFVDILFTNIDCGFLPDENLQLLVNGKLIEDLHGEINKHGNWEITPHPLLEVPSHYLCALTYSRWSSLYFEVPGKFDFKKLSWTVRECSINNEHLCFLLDLTYNGESFNYSESGRSSSQSIWLERYGV